MVINLITNFHEKLEKQILNTLTFSSLSTLTSCSSYKWNLKQEKTLL